MPAEIAVAASGALELDLDVFDGPFDLLVTLILRDEIDIWEVRVSRIIAEYVLRLVDSGEFDLDATSQFVVLVAALLEMKSRLLLEEPDDEIEEIDSDDAAQRLLERLVRYAQFKRAAEALGERWQVHAGRLYRNAPVPPALLRRPAPAGVLAARSLADALSPLLREPPVPDTSHLTDLAVSLSTRCVACAWSSTTRAPSRSPGSPLRSVWSGRSPSARCSSCTPPARPFCVRRGTSATSS